ncbi:type 4 pilus major pilin [Psychromonas sp. SP041]|uniref:type 4 pilus major pilin n=1 Tax=Psychromonas sp. SP041 TaxID=1365007 RepID=UPI0010C784B7|nr:type 4 pilus major pilin [Psychromonas sp. SP041]
MNKSIRNLQLRKPGKEQFGFTLMEIIFALTIIGAATILIISSFNNTGNTEDAQEETQNLNALSASIQHMFKTQGDYEGLENSVIMSDVSFPEQMRNSDDDDQNIKSSWYSNGYNVEPLTQDSDDDSFIITMYGVPEGACTSIVSSTYRHFEEVSVNGSAIDGVASAAVACDGDQDITFTDR